MKGAIIGGLVGAALVAVFWMPGLWQGIDAFMQKNIWWIMSGLVIATCSMFGWDISHQLNRER